MFMSSMLRQCTVNVFIAYVGAILAIVASPLLGQEAAKPAFGKLKYIDLIVSPELDSVNSVIVDKQGKFLYASSWNGNTVNVLSRDAVTGKLTLVQAMNSPRDLDGVTSIHLSEDGMYGVSAAFRAKATVLFKRDLATGRLEFLDVARSGEKGVQGMEWAIDATFSLDHRFVFVADPKGPGMSNPNSPKNNGGIVVFEVTDKERLKWVETNIGEEDCFHGVRGIMMLPDGKTLVATCNNAGNVVLIDWDKNARKTSIRQVITDEKTRATALAGAMKSVSSSDGSTLYVTSGRFQGDNAVSVFRLNKDGQATFLQQMVDNKALTDFVGGNQLSLSPDQRNLYAAATRSGSLACFERDLKTGELTYIETLSNDATGFLNGACGVCVSPDGNHVYVTAEGNNSIAVFERNTVR